MPDIAAWLTTIGLDRYAQTFEDHDIDVDVLPELSEQDFEKLGVTLGHRKKLLRALADLFIAKNGADNRSECAQEQSRLDGNVSVRDHYAAIDATNHVARMEQLLGPFQTAKNYYNPGP